MTETSSPGRSWGLIRKISRDTAAAFVIDFHDLDRDVYLRLRSPWQANPGDLIGYLLEERHGEQGDRYTGSDILFNQNPSMEEMLRLGRFTGLSQAGLKHLVKLLHEDPSRINQIFCPHGPELVQEQILAAGWFPLPDALLKDAGGYQKFAGALTARLVRSEQYTREQLEELLDGRLGWKRELTVLKRVAESQPELLHQPFQLAERGLGRRVWGWYREVGLPELLLNLPVLHIPRELVLGFLRSGALSGERADAYAAKLSDEDHNRMLHIVWQSTEDDRENLLDYWRDTKYWEELQQALLQNPQHAEQTAEGILDSCDTTESLLALLRNPHLAAQAAERLALQELDSAQLLRVWLSGNRSAEALALLISQLRDANAAELRSLAAQCDVTDVPALAKVLLDGGVTAARLLLDSSQLSCEDLLALLGDAEAEQLVKDRVSRDPSLLGELFRVSAQSERPVAGLSAAWKWLAANAEIQAMLEESIADEVLRRAALGCLCHAVEFNRGQVQRLLPLPMEQDLRCALAQAITARSPERWQERYFVSPELAAAWREAGAQLL